ncbi:MAG: aminoacyl-tRNA hydrolase [Desulfuromonadales bacterium]|nr:aminoacyl-tRNA hydrolase [Desulfuromonadales bacterium]
MKLVVGLGNPGERYADTRHNIGFMVAARVASRAGIAIKRQGYQGLYGVGRLVGEEAAILLPQTFMNRSGASVAPACQSLGVSPGDLIVVHDEIDLPYGCLRIKVGGGHGGHNGLRSITDALGHGDFIRMRLGVGRPPAGGDVSGHVLSRFASAERAQLETYLDVAADALEFLLQRGANEAMNTYNNRELLA